MNNGRKHGIRQSRALAACIVVVALALTGCIVTTGEGFLPTPTTVNATQGSYAATVYLTWGAVANASSYNYYYAIGAADSYQYLGNTAANSANVYVPYSSTSYYFKVAAVSLSGVEGVLSAYATGWAYTPTAPTIFATSNLTSQIIVSWYPVNDAVGYNVYDVTGAKYYLGNGVLDASGSYYLYLDKPVAGTYYYKVESIYQDNGISALSLEVGGYAY